MARQLLKAAAAAFLLIGATSGAMAQGNPERERDLLFAAERGEIVAVRETGARRARASTGAITAAAPRCSRRRSATRIEVARFLIQEGADVNAKDLIQDTPFLFAGAEGRTEILKMMLRRGRRS